jgi:hypothetical protein
MAEDNAGRRQRAERARDVRTGGDAAETRMREQARWVDLQVRQAIERGEFDNLPGAGKPIRDLGQSHDPDWWVKRLIEREQITGVLPAALQLRKDDATLRQDLDREPTEREARDLLENFNRRVIEARRQLQGGPPVVTPTRDVESELAGWRERRAARLAAARPEHSAPEPGPRRRRRWFRR